MISFFTIASNDQSYYYLGQIFGNVGTVLQAQNAKLLLGLMFKSLNTTALILGVILIVHNTVVGLLKTAQEGEFLGKQWSSMWVPIRMVIGIASLFPTAAGYSVLQIVLMWIILQGVGAADTLWTVVLNYVSTAGSPYASVAMPTSVNVSQDIQTLFQALTCANTAKLTYPDQYTDTNSNTQNYYYCAANPGDQFCTQPSLDQSMQNPASTVCHKTGNGTISCSIGPGGTCGTLTYGDPSSVSCPGGPDMASQLACVAYKAQTQALVQVVQTLDTAAADVAEYDHTYMEFYNNVNPAPPPPAQWLQNFCVLNGITSPVACCYLGNIPDQKSDPIGYMIAMASPCAKPDSNIFPQSNDNGGGGSDYTNAYQKTIQQVIWPCALGPVLSGQPNPTACMQNSSPNTNFLSTAVTYYTNAINTPVTTLMAQILAENPPALSGFEATAQQQGWLLAGGYYYQIAAMNNNNLNNVIPPLTVNGTDPHTNNNGLTSYRNNYTASGYLIQTILQQSSDPTSIMATNPQLSQIGSGLNSVASGIASLFMNALTGGGVGGTTNPLVAAQSLGEALLITAQVAYFVFTPIVMVLLVVSKLNFIALGNGLTDNPGATAMQFTAYSLYAILVVFLVWAVTTGGLLGIYTPLIPYIIFTFGAIGWFIATIEAMVAAPFVALGILSPGGRHELLGRADAALSIIFNMFLRPSLMILGMMAAMLLAPVVISMINSGFSGVMGTINPNPGILELIIFLTAYTGMVITALNKCFALIHILPDRVLHWIGHQHHGIGSSDPGDANEVKGGTTGMASSVAGRAKSSIRAAGGAVGKSAESKEAASKASGKAGAADVGGDEKK